MQQYEIADIFLTLTPIFGKRAFLKGFFVYFETPKYMYAQVVGSGYSEQFSGDWKAQQLDPEWTLAAAAAAALLCNSQ